MREEEREGRADGAAGQDRHILVAVDGSEVSERAVFYVADFIGDSPGFRVTLFHSVILPDAGDFDDPEGRKAWVKEKEQEARGFLGRYREILTQSGLPAAKVSTAVEMGTEGPVAESILKKQADTGSCTVVIGRRKKSWKEEVLFGSVSSRLIRQAAGCSVWVIE